MLSNLNINEFIEELGSSSPAPGGGSAAALSASIAAALTSMVFNLTVGKKAYKELNDEIQSLIDTSLKKSNDAMEGFLTIMDEDTEVFLSLMAAYKLPKGTEEECKTRTQKIAEGYQRALEVPFKLAEKASMIYELIHTAAQYGNVNAVSDAGVAALMLQATIESAVLNVKINLPYILDKDHKDGIRKVCDDMVAKGNLEKIKIMEVVDSKINR